ncbi:MAG: response regulator transcription factor [Bacteroidales bacterium]
MSTIKIAIVDDNEEFRKAVRYFLEKVPDFAIVGEAGNGYEFIKLAQDAFIDVALVDIRMPEMDGIAATSHVTRVYYPHLKVIAVSMLNDFENLRAMLEAGAMGYINKENIFLDMEQAIRTVTSNKYYYGLL